MGVARVIFRFGQLEPGQNPSLFLHGLSPNNFVAFDLSVASNTPGFHPAARLTVGQAHKHVDNTKAYDIDVENTSISAGGPPKPIVELLAFEETLNG